MWSQIVECLKDYLEQNIQKLINLKKVLRLFSIAPL